MKKTVFLYKELETEDRDCVTYIEIRTKPEENFECDHYFSGIHLVGACFSTGFDYEFKNGLDFNNIKSILTVDDFMQLVEFDKEISELKYGIKLGDERYQRGIALYESIQPIFDKLLSDENERIFEEVKQEEIEWLKDEYNLDDEDIDTIFNEYGLEYRDRGVVSYVWNSIDEAAEEEAEQLGYVTESNSRWFDYEKFGADLLQDERYVELSDGRVAILNY